MSYIDGFRAGLDDCAKEAERMAALMAMSAFVKASMKSGVSKRDAEIASESAAAAYGALALAIRQKIMNADAMIEAAKKGRQ